MQSGSDINVQATNVKSLSGGTLGTPVGSGGSQVNSGAPATSYTGNGYGLYNLHLPRSYYRFNGNMPAVVWDGDFEQTKYDGNGNANPAYAVKILRTPGTLLTWGPPYHNDGNPKPLVTEVHVDEPEITSA